VQILIIVAINLVKFFFLKGQLLGKLNFNLDDLSGEGFQNKCISFWVSRS